MRISAWMADLRGASPTRLRNSLARSRSRVVIRAAWLSSPRASRPQAETITAGVTAEAMCCRVRSSKRRRLQQDLHVLQALGAIDLGGAVAFDGRGKVRELACVGVDRPEGEHLVVDSH